MIPYSRPLLFILISSTLVSCADWRMRQANSQFVDGKYAESVATLEQAVSKDPENPLLRASYLNRRNEAAYQTLAEANLLLQQGKQDEARALASSIFKFDPQNEAATTFIANIERGLRHQQWLDRAKTAIDEQQTERAEYFLSSILQEDTKHLEAKKLLSRLQREQRQHTDEQTLALSDVKPLTLEFRHADLKMIFEVLSRHAGINFVMDKDIQSDLKATIFLRQSKVEDAIVLLTSTNQLSYKILNDKTVLIYPNNPQKQKEYQDLLVKSFFLAHASAETLGSKVKGMFKLRDMIVDDKLNVLVVRDTPETIRAAERLIRLLDKPEPEVVLEVEVLEVNRSRLYELGVNFPNKFTFTPLPPSGNAMTVDFLRNINSSQIGVAFGAPSVNLRREKGDVDILANPQIRVKNREKAKILIGEKLPVVSTTSTATAVSENIQYTEVGIKLEAEPQISLNDEVTIKVLLEVSSVSNQMKTNSGSIAYQIGTRTANTTLQLHDGETQILAGLLNQTERSSANRVPGLGDIPFLGRLFGSTLDDAQKNEILLSITPRLVRNVRRPDVSESEFWSGTEQRLSSKPLVLPTQTSQISKAEDWEGGAIAVPTLHKGETAPVISPNTATASQENVAGNTLVTTSTTAAPAGNNQLSWSGVDHVAVQVPQTLSLQLNTDSEFRGLPLQITFDPEQVTILKVEEGAFFSQQGGAASFSYQVVENKIMIAATRNGTEGVSGNAPLFTIHYQLRNAVTTRFDILQLNPLGDGVLPALQRPEPFSITGQ